MKMKQGKNISRRTALKRIGAVVAGGVMAFSGISSMVSCNRNQKDRKRIVLYFTGTGNCLFVARQLLCENAELLSIPQMVKQNRYEFDADEIGIVYPIYGHMPPNTVIEFMRKARLNASYRFAVLTYGNRKCSAVEIWDALSRECGMAFDYISTIVMVDNWLPNFDMNEQMKIDKHVPENLAIISEAINNRIRHIEPVSEEERLQHAGFMEATGLDPNRGFLMRSEKSFIITDSCIDCGICMDVCPKGNYDYFSKGIVMNGDCDFCFACIQNCPQKAIRFAKNEGSWIKEEVNPDARYRNEHVSLYDIKASNCVRGSGYELRK